MSEITLSFSSNGVRFPTGLRPLGLLAPAGSVEDLYALAATMGESMSHTASEHNVDVVGGGRVVDVDVLVVGSGPAGLQAALTLGRGQRTVAVVEGGQRRNARAHAIHNVLGFDGVDPQTYRDAAWADLEAYGVVRVAGEVEAIDGVIGAFRTVVGGAAIRARRVVLATGMRDRLPDWPGLDALWGPTVFQCPFCHGHEVRGLRWGVFVDDPSGWMHLPLFLAWTSDLVVFADGVEPDEGTAAALASREIAVVQGPIEALVPREDAPERIAGVVVGGKTTPCDALVLRPPQEVVSLVADLGLDLDELGFVSVDDMGRTSEPGVWAVGDTTTVMQAVVGGLALGLKTGAILCHELAHEGWGD